MTEINRTLHHTELVATGYLQEANRLFFHRLGLALAVVTEKDGTLVEIKVLDYREDRAGMIFEPVSQDMIEKAEAVFHDMMARDEARLCAHGFRVQPLGETKYFIETVGPEPETETRDEQFNELARDFAPELEGT